MALEAPAGREVPIVWRGRRVHAFVPALLADRDLTLSSATVARTATAATELAHAAAALPEDREPLARLLLRAEGVASSYIEGIAAPVVDVVLAEADLPVQADAATWVAANLEALSGAVHGTRAEPTGSPLSTEILCQWQRAVLAGSPTPARHVGVLRAEQGWIGGHDPTDAHLVTPPPDALPALVDDLVDFANRDDVDPVAQAAVAHAQFELVHPFADGNGRVGRVLVAWVLARRLNLVVPPPVSVAIVADVGGYSSGLTLFRLGDHDRWVHWFADAVTAGGRAQQALVAEVAALKDGWRRRLEGTPRSDGHRRLRGDATAWRILELLPRHLVLTTVIVSDALVITNKAANTSLRQLADMGVLLEYGTLNRGRGQPAKLYVSRELLALAGSNPLR